MLIDCYLSPFNVRYLAAAHLIFGQLSFCQPEHQKMRQLGRIRHLEGSRCLFQRTQGNAFGLLNCAVFVQLFLSVLGHHMVFS